MADPPLDRVVTFNGDKVHLKPRVGLRALCGISTGFQQADEDGELCERCEQKATRRARGDGEVGDGA